MWISRGEVHLKSKATLKVCFFFVFCFFFEECGDSVDRLMSRVVKGACGI